MTFDIPSVNIWQGGSS